MSCKPGSPNPYTLHPKPYTLHHLPYTPCPTPYTLCLLFFFPTSAFPLQKAFRVCGAKLSWRFAAQMVHVSSAHTELDVYRQRKPQDSAFYRCVEDCFETFEQVYQERMNYHRETGQVEYRSKDGKETKKS